MSTQLFRLTCRRTVVHVHTSRTGRDRDYGEPKGRPNGSTTTRRVETQGNRTLRTSWRRRSSSSPCGGNCGRSTSTTSGATSSGLGVVGVGGVGPTGDPSTHTWGWDVKGGGGWDWGKDRGFTLRILFLLERCVL